MSARQGRLDASYFSASQQSPPTGNGSSGFRAPKSKSQGQSQSQKRTQQKSQPDPEFEDGDDSDGSEGMNNIRLSESPNKVQVRDGGKEGEIVDLISDEEDKEDNTEPAMAIASSSRKPADEVMVIDDEVQEEVEASPVPPLKKVVSLSSSKPLMAVPKKRLDLSSGSSAAFTSIPVPAKFTRLKVISEDRPPSSSSKNRRQTPYVELKKWSEERKAGYTPYPVKEVFHTSTPDNLAAFLGRDMAQDPPMSMPTVHEVIDSSDEEVARPAPKRRAMLAVEIPTRKSNGPSQRAVTQRSMRVDEDSEDERPLEKNNGKSRRLNAFEVDKEAENPRQIKSSKGKERAPALDSDSDQPRRHSKKAKGKGRAMAWDEESVSEESDRPRHRKDKSGTSGKKQSKEKKQKRKEREPSLTQREYLDELALDESTRFKTKTRLREKKETPAQRILRKLQDKRRGIVEPDTPSEESSSEEESEDETSDSAADSRDGRRRSSSFIEDDGGVVDNVMLPHEFSLDSAQTPEYKFKVVFQYFLHLAVQGPDFLPLKGEQKDYFIPQLEDMRRKVSGHRDGRVRSQIWPANYVKALLSYPQAIPYMMDEVEEHCLACNRMNYKSRFRLEFRGSPYDRNTYDPLPSAKEKRREREMKRKAAKAKAKKRARRNQSQTPSSEGSDSDSDEGTTSEEDDLIRPKDDIFLGPHCKKRSVLYHSMAHWEWILLNKIQTYYHDLLRAKSEDVSDDSDASPSETDSDLSDDERQLRKDKRKMRREQTRIRVKKLKRENLPKDPHDPGAVQEWMDEQHYVLNEFKWMEELEDQSKRLEFDRNKDE